MVFTYFIIFCLGSIMGSFINVIGLRFLREESIIFPNSYCYSCNERIQPYDNIPLLSWIILRGKCRSCKAKISIQYPLIEFLTGFLFIAVVYKFGLGLQTAFLLYLMCNFMVILITDFREQYIFDLNSIGLIPFGLIYTYFNLGHTTDGTELIPLGYFSITVPHIFLSALLAVGGAFVIFFILNLFSKLIVGRPGFGEGDTRLLMGIGAFFGLKWMAFIFLLSFIIQAAVGIPMLFRQWIINKAYKTIGLMSGGMALAVTPYFLQYWVHNPTLLLGVVLLFGTIAMFSTIKALKLAKELPIGLTALPFGPAIVFASLLMLFFSEKLLTL